MTATDPLALDLEATAQRLADGIRESVAALGRRGAVLGISGGVDSGVCAGLAVRAFGPQGTLLLRMPERDIGGDASDLGLELATALGAPTVEEPISDALEGLGCYRRRDEAIRAVFPDYEPGWPHKVVRSAPGPHHDVLARGRAARRRAGAPAHPRRPLPRPDRGHEHEAARAQAHGVHLGRPARLRRDRHAQPARVRPGLLRQGRRRPGRRQADRAPLQDAGLRAGPAPRPPRRRWPSARPRPRPSACPRRRRSSTSATPTTAWTCCSGASRAARRPRTWRRARASPADEVGAAYDEIARKRTATAYLHASPVLLRPDGSPER